MGLRLPPPQALIFRLRTHALLISKLHDIRTANVPCRTRSSQSRHCSCGQVSKSASAATDVRFSRIIAASADHVDCEFVRADYGVRIINALLAQPLHLKVVSLSFKRGLAGRLNVVLSLHMVHELVQQRAPVLQAIAAPIVRQINFALVVTV